MNSIFQRLTFRVLFGLLLIDVILLAGIYIVMSTTGSDKIFKLKNDHITQVGTSIKKTLLLRLKEIEGLSRTIGNIGEDSIGREKFLLDKLPHIIDFDKDLDIAGGGLWYEPKSFDGKSIRKSFFWGRDKSNNLVFFDDYNKPGPIYNEERFNKDEKYRKEFLDSPGYHNEEWYVIAKEFKVRNKGIWSRSYSDPYTNEPMVTVSSSMFNKKGEFIGVATIDLKLEGLKKMTDSWGEFFGGYIYILDRDGQFITYPNDKISKNIKRNEKGDIVSSEFKDYETFHQEQSWFSAEYQELKKIDQKTIEKTKDHPRFSSELLQKIDRESYQIDQREALNVLTLYQDPLDYLDTLSDSLTFFSKDNDFFIKEKSYATVFNVPDCYWKLVLVKPYEAYISTAIEIRNYLIKVLALIVLISFLLAIFYQITFFTRPMNQITHKIQGIVKKLSVESKKLADLDDIEIEGNYEGELKSIANSFNELTSTIQNVDLKFKRRSENLLRVYLELGSKKKKEEAVQIAIVYLITELRKYKVKHISAVFFDGDQYLRARYSVSPDGVVLKVGEKIIDRRAALVNFKLAKRFTISEEKNKLFLPISIQGVPIGRMVLYCSHKPKKIDIDDYFYMESIREALSLSLSNITFLSNMKELVEDKTKELKKVQKQILEAAHEAGKAEIAVGILHNIGNSVTPALTNVSIIKDQISGNGVFKRFKMLNELISEKEDLIEFMTEDSKGQKIPSFLKQQLPELTREIEVVERDLQELQDSLNQIRDIIRSQNAIAKKDNFVTQVEIVEMLEKAVHTFENEFKKYGVSLEFEGEKIPTISSNQGKIMQIFNNLVLNAKDASLQYRENLNNKIICKARRVDDQILISVTDFGIGIEKENIRNLFAFGFTTKESGHGFGLHSSFNLAKELGGSLTVESAGFKRGATFTLTLPIKNADEGSSAA